MAITLRTFDTNASLATQQATLRESEALGFRVLSVTTARVGGGLANIVTFVQQARPPAVPITLQVVDGSLDQNAQEAVLNAPGPEVVCYGMVLVDATPQNVLVVRA